MVRVFLPCGKLLGDRFDGEVQRDKFFESDYSEVFQQTNVETENFRVFTCLLDGIPLFFLCIGTIDIGDEFYYFIFDFVAERVFVLFREFFDDSECLYQEIVGRSVYGEMIVLSHIYVGFFTV